MEATPISSVHSYYPTASGGVVIADWDTSMEIDFDISATIDSGADALLDDGASAAASDTAVAIIMGRT